MATTVQKYFAYAHLPTHLQVISRPIAQLAHLLEATLPDGPEKSAGMRKLLEAKDCMVRAALDASPAQLLNSAPITDSDRIDFFISVIQNPEKIDKEIPAQLADAIFDTPSDTSPWTRELIISKFDQLITHLRAPTLNTEGPDEFQG